MSQKGGLFFNYILNLLTITFCKHHILTSCGGTSKLTVLRSTFLKLSIQGRMKNRPGPFAPPARRRPSLGYKENYEHLSKLLVKH